MSKLVIGLAAFVLLAAGGALAGGALTDSTSNSDTTTQSATTTDIGTTTAGTTTSTTTTGEDVSGPCDEAEHANDARCTGTEPAEDDDRRGHDGNGDRDHDRSGPNRGPG
jgi:hypothetical protein